MKLIDYLKMKGYSITEFAHRIKYTYTHVSRCMKGKVKPGAKFKHAVEQCTRNLVMWEDWDEVQVKDE